MILPTRSLPVSLMKLTGNPALANDTMPLNTEPPGTAAVRLSVPEDDVKNSFTNTDYFSHNDLDFSPK